MRKIEVGQGPAHDAHLTENFGFGDVRRSIFDVSLPKWLEELVSKSNTIQTRRYNTAGEDCRQYQAETMYKVWLFFIIIAGFINSFGLAFYVRSE